MNINLMTAKTLKLAIKNGLTPEDLMEKYECTEEELKKRIGQLYNQGKSKVSQDLYAELEANRKKHHRKAEEVADKADEVAVQSTTEGEPAPIIVVKTLEDLRKEEQILSNSLIDLEGRHKAFAERRRLYKKNLEELKNSIDKIKAKLEEYSSEFENCLREANLLAVEMNNLCVPIHAKRVALGQLRQEIEDRETTTLFVYEDGHIEADDPGFVLNDKGYQDLKPELSEREECLDLKLRDITTLARLLIIAKDAQRVVLVCDNEELEKAFHAIRGE